MGEVKTTIKNTSWLINSACNFKCPYCINNVAGSSGLSIGNPDIQPAIDFFNKTGPWDINLVGGEPFLHPKFLELCQELTKKNKISIITNLSSSLVYKFAETIDPKSVRNILCSMHFPELEKRGLIDEFIKKYNLLKNKGFTVRSGLVMWPPLIKRADEIFKYFRKNGVDLTSSSFIGIYDEKKYPESYTAGERQILEKYSDVKEENFPHLTKEAVTYKGKYCKAGYSHVIVRSSGEVSRCHSDNSSLGNIYTGDVTLFSKPKRCPFPQCVCPSEGYYYSDKKPRPAFASLEQRIKNIKNKKLLLRPATIYDVDKHYHDLPFMNLNQAEFLRDLFLKNNIKKCLELGFAHGKSSAYIAAIINELHAGGSLVTIDLEKSLKISPQINEVLEKLGLQKYVTIHAEPKSYIWRLMKMIEENHSPIFDFCYIDGGHTFYDTGFAFFLVDKLIKPGGWIIFDDLYWSIEKNGNPVQHSSLPEEEIKTCQILKVWELLVKKHEGYHNFSQFGWWGVAQKKLN